ncbi:unnamed protein product, partial [Amoebophrya sp. A25]|eukprot:GSA25T00010355001.1
MAQWDQGLDPFGRYEVHVADDCPRDCLWGARVSEFLEANSEFDIRGMYKCLARREPFVLTGSNVGG